MFSKNSLIIILLLVLVWIILRGELTLPVIAMGVVLSFGCVFFCKHFLPLPESSDIKILRLIVYVFYVAGQMYAAGIAAVKLLVTGARAEIVQVKTGVSHTLLRTLLVNSITLIPGTVSLDSEGEDITVLWLVDKKAPPEQIEKADEQIIKKLEKRLSRAEG